MGFFPYAPRPHQEVARARLLETAELGGHAAIEMPTGSGKTVVLLSAALEAAQRARKRVLYVSRTHSQQENTIREFNAIRAASGLPLRGYALQGRARLCLKLEETNDPEWREATPEELSHFCSAAKAASDREPNASKSCRFFTGLKQLTPEQLQEFPGAAAQTAEVLRQRAKAAGVCPYEAIKILVRDADLVVAPYVFALDPNLRHRLLEWWGCREEDVILVVDEAHNVPSYLRELFSPRLTRDRLRRALREADELGNPEVSRTIRCAELLEAMAQVLDACVEEYCKQEDGFLPPFEVEAALLARFSTTTASLRAAANAIVQLGEIVKDRRRLLGKVPRSHLSHVAQFLTRWLDSDEEGFVKLAGREPSPYLEAFLVDTARAAETLQRFHATLHASATLDPLDEYRASLGLPEETLLEKFPSPFPKDRLQIRAVAGVSTRFEDLQADPAAVDALQEATRRVLQATRVSAACFLPSHRLVEDFREVGVFSGLSHPPLVETPGLAQDRLMALVARHRSDAGSSLLVGVVGGRLSEGMDFPGRELEAVVLVGVPYPRPTAHQRALFHYHESRHGRGWDYAVKAPALRRLRQAIGRLIRSEGDRGFAIVLDERAGPLLESAGHTVPTLPLDRVLADYADWQARRSEVDTFK